jgi:hypothetical protein
MKGKYVYDTSTTNIQHITYPLNRVNFGVGEPVENSIIDTKKIR